MQLATLKQKANLLNVEVYALYLSCRDSRVKWYASLLIALAVGYALSPLDLVPDLTPVFGFLDDVVVVTAGVGMGYQLLSRRVLEQARLQAWEVLSSGQAAEAYRVIVYAWAISASLAAILGYKLLFTGMQ